MRSTSALALRASTCLTLAALAGLAAPAAYASERVALITIEGKPAEKPGPFDWLAPEAADKNPTLRSLVASLDRAAKMDDLPAVMIKLRDAELGRTQVEELGAAMSRAKAAGKKIYVFSDAYGPTELLLASHASKAIAQKGAPVMLGGMHMEEIFLADTLAWAGLKANMVQIGDYKGASEQMSRSAPSKEWSQNIDQLLDSIYANMRGELKEGRGLNDAQLDAAMKDLWLGDSDDAAKHKLVDEVIDFPTIKAKIGSDLGVAAADADEEIELDPDALASAKKSSIDMSNPFAMFSLFQKKPDHEPKGPTIAILHVDGTIIDGDSTEGGLFGGSSSVGSRTFRNAIEEILIEDQIKGVIVRIDSPGGSATASEIMWQGLRRLAEKKKVWASVGSMAASGGYYVAVGTDKIYVNPSSIVGSIGVVGGRIGMDGLYKHLRVNVHSRSRGPMADMFRSTTEWSPEEVATVRAKMTDTYNQFTSRVTAGRKGIDLKQTAEGRLFTGDKAIGLKMADKVGGMDDAIKDMASELALSKYDVMDYPGPKSLEEILEDLFGGLGGGNAHAPAGKLFAAAAGGDATALQSLGAMISNSNNGSLAGINLLGREVFGPAAWPQVSRGIQGLLLLRDQPVVLMTPSVYVFE